ncbi:MAG: phosphotransferase, partial [Gammaproteobacteria bacterium]
MASDPSLSEWVEMFLPDQYRGHAPLSMKPLSGDAGFRSYYRINCQPSLLAVSAPPQHENNAAFVDIALLLQTKGVHTPVIFAVNYECGYLLLEDFGDQLLLPLLNEQTVDRLYEEAESALLAIQKATADNRVVPVYDRQRLLDEMTLFPEWFVARLLGLELSTAEHQLIQQAFGELLDSALSQPTVLVHRDFHSRNLMLLDNGGIGVID